MNTLPRRKILSGALACGVFAEILARATPAQADLFGGDVAVLLAILTQSISSALSLVNLVTQTAYQVRMMTTLLEQVSKGSFPALISFINAARFTYNSLTWGIRSMSYQLARIDSEYNSLFPAGVLADEGPSVSFGGNYISNTPSFGSNFPNFADNTNFNFVDNLAKVFSRHTLTFGFSIERDRKDQSNGNPNGNLNFSTASNNPYDTGFTWANALAGNFNTRQTSRPPANTGSPTVSGTWLTPGRLVES